MPKEIKENWEKEFFSRFTHDWPPKIYTKEEIPDLPWNIIHFFHLVLKSEKAKWEKEQIIGINKRVLESIKKEQGTDEFYETIVKPIERRVKEKLLERVLNMVFIEVKRKSIQNGEYGLSAGEAEEIREKLKEELKKELCQKKK